MEVLIEAIYSIIVLIVLLYNGYFFIKHLKKLKDKESFLAFMDYYAKVFFSGVPILLVLVIQLSIQFSSQALQIAKFVTCSIASIIILYNWIRVLRKVKKEY